MNAARRLHHYFVDEAGDLAILDRKGRVIVGSPGVSRCFVVGAALINDPEELGRKLDDLRARIIDDPYFAGVPSLSRAAGKTALLFHAKDDTAEVRREVFSLLRHAGGVEIYAAFRRKVTVAEDLVAHYRRTGTKLGPDFVYDELVTGIFQNRLHLADENHIIFARRGKSDRNIALTRAIQLAKFRFEMRWKKGIDRPTFISSTSPSASTGLQVVDYYLWALQRLLERREHRYFDYVRSSFRLVIDRDDTRHHRYGEYYTASGNPLTAEKMMPVT